MNFFLYQLIYILIYNFKFNFITNQNLKKTYLTY